MDLGYREADVQIKKNPLVSFNDNVRVIDTKLAKINGNL